MNRRSYEARVLLAPIDGAAVGVAEAFTRLGLSGVTVVAPEPAAAAGNGQGTPEARAVAGHDVVVLLGADLRLAAPSAVTRIGAAARAAGCLVAGLLVGSTDDTDSTDSTDSTDDTGGAAMAALREAVDMLVAVRSTHLAASFLDVVRGGGERVEAGGASGAHRR